MKKLHRITQIMKDKAGKTGLVAAVVGMVLFAGVAVFVHSSQADDILIIANKDIPVSSLTAEELKSIFLGEKVKWNDRQTVAFVLLMTDIHESFLKKYLGISSVQYSQYWKKMIFTGRAKSPKAFNKPEELCDYVANTSGCIGYVPSPICNDKVKTISVR